MRMTSACLALLLVFQLSPLLSASPLPAAPPGARQLAPGVLLVPGRFVAGTPPDGNSLIFQGSDGLVLFDTGRHREHAERLLAAAAVTGLPPRAVVNSHWHLDHVGGNLLVRERYPRVEVYASGAIHGALRGFLAQYRASLTDQVARAQDPGAAQALRDEIALIDAGPRLGPTHEVKASGPLALAGRPLELHLETFAVTAGDVWLLDPASGVLAAGDLVTLPVPLLDTACPARWQAALDHLATVPFRQLVPGHGEPMNHAGFDAYRSAFRDLLACAASARGKDACIDGWLRDAGSLVPPEDVTLARQALGYYVAAVLRGDPAKRAKLCSPPG